MPEKGAVREQSLTDCSRLTGGKGTFLDLNSQLWIQEVNMMLKQYITYSGHPSQSRTLNILGSDWKPGLAESSESLGGEVVYGNN